MFNHGHMQRVRHKILCKIWYSTARTVSDPISVVARSALSPSIPRLRRAAPSDFLGLTAQRDRTNW
jgi:hypothetical protein